MNRWINVCLFCCLMVLGSCKQNDFIPETTEVVLRVSDSRAADPNATSVEGIQKLRVFAVQGEEGQGKIIYNEVYDFSNDTDPLLEKTFRLYDIPEGMTRFYVIANEEQYGIEFTTQKISEMWASADPNSHKLEYVDEQRTYLPKQAKDQATDSNNEIVALPISGKAVVDVKKGMDPITIPVVRAAVKIKVSVSNMVGTDITLQQVNFGNFFSDRVYIINETNLDVPSDANYAGATFVVKDRLIKTGTAEEFIFYAYPTFAYQSGTDNPYRIGFTTAGGGYPLQVFVKNGQGLNSIARNTQLNINATITKEAQVILNFEVTGWESKDIDIPSFN